MLKPGKNLDFHSSFINKFLFSKTSLVHESNSVPGTVNKQLLHISTKIKQSSILSNELKIGHV